MRGVRRAPDELPEECVPVWPSAGERDAELASDTPHELLAEQVLVR
jgi:hypothetical protein